MARSTKILVAGLVLVFGVAPVMATVAGVIFSLDRWVQGVITLILDVLVVLFLAPKWLEARRMEVVTAHPQVEEDDPERREVVVGTERLTLGPDNEVLDGGYCRLCGNTEKILQVGQVCQACNCPQPPAWDDWICEYCGSENDKKDLYCPNCGK